MSYAKKRPEPFWREQTQCYYVQLGKKQHRLSPDDDEAWRLYHELMANPPQEHQAPAGDRALLVEIFDAFLEWAKRNRAPRT